MQTFEDDWERSSQSYRIIEFDEHTHNFLDQFCIFKHSKLVVDTEADTGRPSIDRNILQNSTEEQKIYKTTKSGKELTRQCLIHCVDEL